MVLGHQHFRNHRVMDPLADFITHEFGVVLVGLTGKHDVIKIGQPFPESRFLPQPFILLQPLFR